MIFTFMYCLFIFERTDVELAENLSIEFGVYGKGGNVLIWNNSKRNHFKNIYVIYVLEAIVKRNVRVALSILRLSPNEMSALTFWTMLSCETVYLEGGPKREDNVSIRRKTCARIYVEIRDLLEMLELMWRFVTC